LGIQNWEFLRVRRQQGIQHLSIPNSQFPIPNS